MGNKNEEIDQMVGQYIVDGKGNATPYVLEEFVAGGAFGQIYAGLNENTNQKVAIKLERKDAPHRQLYLEFGFYMRLTGCSYSPKIYTFGFIDRWDALIMEMLGPSLMKLFKSIGPFTAACTASLGIKLMTMFKDFHGRGMIFRDVKPDNFLLGKTDTNAAHTLYMIDLGLAKDWLVDNAHIPFAEHKVLTGTPQYISVNMHKSYELSRRDDLESILYMLIHIQTGTLPWLVADKEFPSADQIRDKLIKYAQMKENLTRKQVCAKMSSHFRHVYKKVRKLEFDQNPDYKEYIKCFGRILEDNDFASNDLNRALDWNQSHKRRPITTRERLANRSNSKTTSQSPRRSRSKERRSSKHRHSKKRDDKSK